MPTKREGTYSTLFVFISIFAFQFAITVTDLIWFIILFIGCFVV